MTRRTTCEDSKGCIRASDMPSVGELLAGTFINQHVDSSGCIKIMQHRPEFCPSRAVNVVSLEIAQVLPALESINPGRHNAYRSMGSIPLQQINRGKLLANRLVLRPSFAPLLHTR